MRYSFRPAQICVLKASTIGPLQITISDMSAPISRLCRSRWCTEIIQFLARYILSFPKAQLNLAHVRATCRLGPSESKLLDSIAFSRESEVTMFALVVIVRWLGSPIMTTCRSLLSGLLHGSPSDRSSDVPLQACTNDERRLA